MIKCPYCGRAAMTLWQKSSLGPGRAVGCKSCGRRVTAHPLAVFAAIPAFLGGYAMLKSDSLALGLAAVVGGLLMMGLLHTFLVPLMKSEA